MLLDKTTVQSLATWKKKQLSPEKTASLPASERVRQGPFFTDADYVIMSDTCNFAGCMMGQDLNQKTLYNCIHMFLNSWPINL